MIYFVLCLCAGFYCDVFEQSMRQYIHLYQIVGHMFEDGFLVKALIKFGYSQEDVAVTCGRTQFPL